METNPTIGDVINGKGLSQGVMIPGASMRYICSSATENHEWITQCDGLAVLSQDCDLFQDSLEKEPYAEFFCIKFRDTPNHSLMYGKNPRILHLVENETVYEVLIHQRIRVARECLLEHIAIELNQRLSEESLRLLLFWMTNRYNRHAFPDAFNAIVKDSKT